MILARLADEWLGFVLPGALPSIGRDLDLSYAQAGTILAMPSIAGFVEPPITIAADFLDRRIIAVAGALAAAGALFAFATAGSFAVLVVAGFVMGLAHGAFVNGCEVALVDEHRDDPTPVLARMNAFGALGDVLGPLTLAGAAAAGIGWRWVFAAAGTLMLGYALLLVRARFAPPSPPDGATPRTAVMSLLRRKRILALAALIGLFSALDEPFLSFTIAHLRAVRGMSPAIAGLLVTVLVTAGIAGAALAPRIARGRTTRRSLLVHGVTFTLAMAALALSTHAVVLFGAAAAFGFAVAAFWTVVQALYVSLAPGLVGTASAVATLVGFLDVGVPPLAGVVSDASGLTAGVGVYVGVGALVVAAIAIFPRLTDSPSARAD